jgi:hypothetical protein
MLLMAFLFLLPLHSIGETIDRVVAFMDDKAITERELERQYAKDVALFPGKTRRETLEAMINTSLMLEDARRLHLWAKDDAELLRKYLDLKIRASVFISDRNISDYYTDNKSSFGGRGMGEMKSDIRTYLEELEFNKALKEHIASLRASAIIVILDLPQSD